MIVGHHPPCFEEINDAVEALTDAPVVFGAAQYPHLVPPGAVVYNLDLVGHHLEANQFPDRTIWDFSERNCELWKKGGRTDVVHVPIGYHPSMKRFSRNLPGHRDIDVAFFGSMNPRRRHVFNRLQRFGYTLVVQYGTNRHERDRLLARSRLAINLLFWEDGVFPILRAAHLLSNGVYMVAESSPEMLEGIVSHPYGRLVDVVRQMLTKPDARLDELAALDFQAFQKKPLTLPIGKEIIP